jgi:hypothetical protein
VSKSTTLAEAQLNHSPHDVITIELIEHDPTTPAVLSPTNRAGQLSTTWPSLESRSRGCKVRAADQPLPSLARSPSPQPAETPKRQGRW